MVEQNISLGFIVSIVSIIIGSTSLYYSRVSIKGQEKTDKRIQRKERLREASELLRELQKNLDSFLEGFGDEDELGRELDLLSRDLFSHFTDTEKSSDALIRIENPSKDPNPTSPKFDTVDEAIQYLKDGKVVSITECYVENGKYSGSIRYNIGYDIVGYTYFYRQLEEIDRYKNSIENIYPDLLNELEGNLDDLARLILESLIGQQSIKIDVSEFSSREELESEFYDRLYNSRDLDNKLEEMEQFSRDLEYKINEMSKTSIS